MFIPSIPDCVLDQNKFNMSFLNTVGFHTAMFSVCFASFHFKMREKNARETPVDGVPHAGSSSDELNDYSLWGRPRRRLRSNTKRGVSLSQSLGTYSIEYAKDFVIGIGITFILNYALFPLSELFSIMMRGSSNSFIRCVPSVFYGVQVFLVAFMLAILTRDLIMGKIQPRRVVAVSMGVLFGLDLTQRK